jgi:hypothetical protein
MLYDSLIVAAILLASLNAIAFGSRAPGGKIVGVCLVFLVGLPFVGIVLKPVVVLAALLPVAVIIWKGTARRGAFLRLSLGVTLVAFGLATLVALKDARGFARLRAAYPYESMEDRVPIPKPSLRTTLTAEVLSRLDGMEGHNTFNSRSDRLRRLHEDAVGLFVDSYGFGVGRMTPPAPTEAYLAAGLRNEPVPAQPGPRPGPAQSPGEWRGVPTGDAPFLLTKLHVKGVSDFVNSLGFGTIKDRRHVAGFESHRFSVVPEDKRWRVQTLDLVGLLLHDEPRVYVSESLPRMDELRGAPTRPLDPFETQGLKALLAGDDFVIVRDGDVVRMLGSLRSTRQCVACHGGERGDLLGAFSYALRQEERPAPPAEPVASNEARSATSPARQ